LDLDGDFFFF